MQYDAIKELGRPTKQEALYVRRTNVAQQWAQKADKEAQHLTIETILLEYRHHAQVFCYDI
jgi:hypothetical protein